MKKKSKKAAAEKGYNNSCRQSGMTDLISGAYSYDSDENVFHLYLKEINRIPLLSKEEEEKTARLAARGNKAARERLVNANLRFTIMIAKKYQGKGLPLEDLISEGNIGLINAAKNFEVEKGYRFITYAVWWIRQAITKAIHEKGRIIRLPYNKGVNVMRIEKTRQLISNSAKRKDSDEIREVAAFLDMPLEEVEMLIQLSKDSVYLEDPTSKHGAALTLKDHLEDEYAVSPADQAINSVLSEDLEKALNSIEERAADVIRCRFGLGGSTPMTLSEVGNRYNMSRERVRQIEKNALRSLQLSSLSARLGSYTA